MPQESVSQLVNFVYEAFGSQCAALLMVGFDEEPLQAKEKFYVLEVEASSKRQWEIEVVAKALPCHSEPLVLAALLKILIRRKEISSPLEFQMIEVVDELRQAGITFTHGSIDRIIFKYVTLFYDKRAIYENEPDEDGGGVYSLITAYFRSSANETGGTSSKRAFNSIHFDPSFVAGLRKDEIILAGIHFGRLGQTPE